MNNLLKEYFFIYKRIVEQEKKAIKNGNLEDELVHHKEKMVCVKMLNLALEALYK